MTTSSPALAKRIYSLAKEKGIKIIAEGHVMLLRRLNEALKITEDDEMLRLRVNVLECDMSKVKEKLAVG